MTSESRHFIDMKEILGIQYECPECHARISYAMDTVPLHQPFRCKGCGVGIDNSDSGCMENLVRTIKHLQSRGEAIKYFRLEIAGESA